MYGSMWIDPDSLYGGDSIVRGTGLENLLEVRAASDSIQPFRRLSSYPLAVVQSGTWSAPS